MNPSTKFQLTCFGMGQVIMLLNVVSGIMSKYATNEGVSLPTLQSAFLYACLALVYIPVKFLFRRSKSIGVPIWFYMILAVVDVEGNYFAVKAFSKANYVTVGLLLNLTVPFATAFCYIFLKTRYSLNHYIGAMIAVCGSIVIFAVDYDAASKNEYSDELLGDFYCVIAAAFYATSNVMIQWVVKVRDMDSNIELLGFLGLFASIVSAVQIAVLELDPIKDVVDQGLFTGNIYGYYAGFLIALFSFYTIVSIFLRWAESLMFNLSLLSGPVFTVFASYYLFDEPVKGWYWFALVLFYIGLGLYTLTPAPQETHALLPQTEDEYNHMQTPTLERPAYKDENRYGSKV